ncbi:hypothetical protein GPECTOR_16g730 [Gonium pectorale]|uniref:Uncharacterized protein n=1 Tax=Gonium pectorale TaxID=33097 RepID=A0A150GLE2_GONPE|nr:hypothetical protein GPECTOR_16g730 [Gonium pectorale]|eukprot:KXZ50555.1 hypothetical protein GPECTOR_16g730 [Gonium pectorale]
MTPSEVVKWDQKVARLEAQIMAEKEARRHYEEQLKKLQGSGGGPAGGGGSGGQAGGAAAGAAAAGRGERPAGAPLAPARPVAFR